MTTMIYVICDFVLNLCNSEIDIYEAHTGNSFHMFGYMKYTYVGHIYTKSSSFTKVVFAILRKEIGVWKLEEW